MMDDYEDRRLYLLVSDLEVMRTCNGFEAMQVEASSWMRACFWRDEKLKCDGK